MENVSVLREEGVEVVGEVGDLIFGADGDSSDEDSIVLKRQGGGEHGREEKRDLQRVRVQHVVLDAEDGVKGPSRPLLVVVDLAHDLEVDGPPRILAVVHFHEITQQQFAVRDFAELKGMGEMVS